MTNTLSERDVWSPSNTSFKQQQAQQEIPSLFTSSLVEEFAKYCADKTIRGEKLGELHAIQDEMLELIASGKVSYVARLEAELESVCADGIAAEKAVVAAERYLWNQRQEQVEQMNKQSSAGARLQDAIKKPLNSRFSIRSEDEARKRAIANAEEHVRSVEAEIRNNYVDLPGADRAIQAAKARVNELDTKAKNLRAEIAALTGSADPDHIVGTSVNGLQVR